MSILRAMYAGVSGLTAETSALGVVGDNVANTNTVGFKQSRAIFADVLGEAVGGHGAGSGVRMTRTQQIFAQGALVNTGQATDVALSGDGFLVVNGTVDGTTSNFYTRAGQLTLKNDGSLVNADGLAVQGYAADPVTGKFTSLLGGIKLPSAPIPPKATGNLTISANLDASAEALTAPWDPANPGATSNLATSMTVYDSLGNAHAVDVYFRKTASGAWDYHALAKGSELAGGPPTGSAEIAGGTLAFDSNGALTSTAASGPGAVTFAGAATQTLTFDFGSPTSTGGTGLDGMTQYGSPSSVAAQSQDGYASGALSGVRIDSNGVVNGVYTNGQTIAAGQLAIAKFQSNDGLARTGHNLWTATPDSGDAALGAVGEGGRAALVSGSLEQSNVDVTQQFVELISHQRAFQANSKTITTADQMLQELMTIKQ